MHKCLIAIGFCFWAVHNQPSPAWAAAPERPAAVGRMPAPGEPMLMATYAGDLANLQPPGPEFRASPPGTATYAGDLANLQICRDLGFTIFQTDSDHLSTNQTGPEAWDWAKYDKERDKVHEAGGRWMFFPHFAFPPPWFREKTAFTRLRCLEHDQTVEAFSLWDPKAVEFLDEGYRALAAHYGRGTENVFALYLGVHGDYGECMYPAACRVGTPDLKADWERRFGNLHNHYGYWCGDELARAAFRRSMLSKYGSLAKLNQAWGTAFPQEAAIAYPQSAGQRRWRLDFVRWYLDSMCDYAREVAKAANRHFPDSIKMFPLGGWDEDPRIGQDNTALVKMAGQEKVQVRSTHGGCRPFAVNACLQLARIATAAKFYGVPFWSEPPSRISPEGEVGRIFESICCGAAGFWDWHANPLQPKAQEVFRRYRPMMIVDPPVVEVAVLYPQTYHYLRSGLRSGNGLPRLYLELGQELRDVVHFDILDEKLVADGALDRYRYLIHLEGDVFEQSTLEKIAQWVRGGRVFCALVPGKVGTVEGDPTVFERLLPGGKTGQAQPLGEGTVCVLKGERPEKQAYFQMLREVLYSKPPGKDRRPVASVDTEADGVYGVVLQSGRALLHNPSNQAKTKAVQGVRYELPPASIVEIKRDERGR